LGKNIAQVWSAQEYLGIGKMSLWDNYLLEETQITHI
jgi:hypothetical protein